MQVYKDMPWLKDLLQVAKPWWDFLRQLEYGILKFLAHLVDACYEALNALLGVDLMKISPIQKFIGSFSSVTWAVLTVAIAAGGVYMIVNGSKNKLMFKNLLVSTLLIVSIPFMFTTLNEFKDAGISDMQSQMSGETSVGRQILSSNIVDVSKSLKGPVKIADYLNPYYLDINARLPKEGPWLYQITSVSEYKGQCTLWGEKLDNGFFNLGEDRLYTYNFKFVMPLLSMLIILAAMFFAGFKIARIIFDLLSHQAVAGVVFASDINNGSRSKKFMQSLVGSFIVLVLILVEMKIFLDVSAWINGNISNELARLFMIGGAGWGVIDGPDIFIKILGVDAGIRSATSVLLGANAAVGAANGAAHFAGGALHTATGAAGNVAGAMSAMPSIGQKFREGIGEASKHEQGLAGFTNSINQEAKGAKPFAAGSFKVGNTAEKAGFALTQLSNKLHAGHSINGSNSSDNGKSGLEQADKATGGISATGAQEAAAAPNDADTPANSQISDPPDTDSTPHENSTEETAPAPFSDNTVSCTDFPDKSSDQESAIQAIIPDNAVPEHAVAEPVKKTPPPLRTEEPTRGRWNSKHTVSDSGWAQAVKPENNDRKKDV